MELAIDMLQIPNVELMPRMDINDPYRMIQVHDMASVNYIRPLSLICQPSMRRLVDLFQDYYPELVSHKYFTNIERGFGLFLGAVKMFNGDTFRKTSVVNPGTKLAKKLPPIQGQWPVEFNDSGVGDSVRSGRCPLLADPLIGESQVSQTRTRLSDPPVIATALGTPGGTATDHVSASNPQASSARTSNGDSSSGDNKRPTSNGQAPGKENQTGSTQHDDNKGMNVLGMTSLLNAAAVSETKDMSSDADPLPILAQEFC
jgi:hypothetical protein